MELVFDRNFRAQPGVVERLTPRIECLVADNAGPFTFTGTGVYILGGSMVIDPGPDSPAHLAALRRALAGRKIGHILVTHSHADHSPAARALRDWTGAPIYGFGPHPAEADGFRFEEGGDSAFAPDILLKDGDTIQGDGFTVECLHTPGHLSNHLCFGLREENALFTGDHVMGWATTMISPPEGDMAAYMASLEKLLARDDAVYYPTHGGPIRNPRPYVEALLEHRRAREAQIMACLGAGMAAIPAMVERLYADVDTRLHPAAVRSVLAHLIKLVREGRVAEEAGGYRLL